MSEMKVYVHGPCNGVTKIEFCCDGMSDDFLTGKIKITVYNDRLRFNAQDCKLFFCYHCGEKINIIREG
jgi:hypothetical protein